MWTSKMACTHSDTPSYPPREHATYTETVFRMGLIMRRSGVHRLHWNSYFGIIGICARLYSMINAMPLQSSISMEPSALPCDAIHVQYVKSQDSNRCSDTLFLSIFSDFHSWCDSVVSLYSGLTSNFQIVWFLVMAVAVAMPLIILLEA